MLKVAILDDYQNIAQEFIDLKNLSSKFDIEIFSEPFENEEDAIEKLKEFEALLIMRERTSINSNIIKSLKKLKYISTSGMRNKAIDLEATKKAKIIVTGTEINSNPTCELTWALILGLARNIKVEVDNMYQGYWQTTVGVELKGKILSTHCHNDLGLAVANSLAGVQAGARQIECTINGLGERAGNAALEEVVMAMKTRPDLMPFETGIETTLLSKASKIVSNATGFPVQYNKAIVGKNAFAHEAGIHQDGMLKNRQTYEIMTPESVGVQQTSLVMGKHSGRHAFKDKLTSLGYPDLTDDIVDNAFAKFKILADKKKHVYDEDIIALIDDSLIIDNKVNAINLKSLKVFAGTGEPQRAEMTLDVFGEIKQASETGDGPVDAIFKCIKKLYPHEVNLQLYQVHAVTEGTDAQATVSVKIEENGKTTVGQAADTDTLVASANAYINALNKMIIKRDKTAPGQNLENQNYENQKMKGI